VPASKRTQISGSRILPKAVKSHLSQLIRALVRQLPVRIDFLAILLLEAKDKLNGWEVALVPRGRIGLRGD
jgi:hypothetical protein